MSTISKFGLAAIASAVLMAISGVSQATVVSVGSNNPLAFSWSYNTGNPTPPTNVTGLLTGSGSMSVSGFNTSLLTVAITLTNTSPNAGNGPQQNGGERLTAFGFGIDPNATGASFSDPQGNDGGMVGAVLGGNFPAYQTIEVCAYGGPNCAGGGSEGINGGGASDSFNIILAGSWGPSVNIDPIGFKYQTAYGSFEFTTVPSSSTTSTGSTTTSTGSTTTSTSGGNAPEPSSTALVGLALGLLGLSALNRRRQKRG